jgi:exonuclease SbcC
MINKVEMFNWRAYDKQVVTFKPGITFIMGANGAGKTSILEAIAYALTGEPSTVKDPAKLLRDPEFLATVRLHFTAEDHAYVVERSQSLKRAGDAVLIRTGDRNPLVKTHKGVTARIEGLMGVSADFLQRIVYMAEGDVFRFLSDPPGNALDQQVRRVLGLTQLDEFVTALAQVEKEIKSQITESQDLLEEFERLGICEDGELARRLQGVDEHRQTFIDKLRSLQNDIARQRRENEDLLRLVPLLDRAVKVLERHPETLQKAKQSTVLALFSDLEQHAEEARSGAQAHQMSLARLEGESQAYGRVRDILQPYFGRDETVPCPVCGKPMTAGERERVLSEIRQNLDRITEDRKRLKALEEQSKRLHAVLKEQADGLRELRNFITHVTLRSVKDGARITDLQAVAQTESKRLGTHLQNLEREADALEQGIAGLEKERAAFLTLQSQLETLGHGTMTGARDALIRLETRSLSLRAARQAAENTLSQQRNVDMEAIYSQIASVWQAFMGRGGWQLQLSKGGMPILEDDQGRQFDLSQFSGGEKTALLVILHTIIARHFSNSDFLLIDEPLEHLDPVNRRSLKRFLVSAYHRGAFKQAIVTTFEESLIRKYVEQEGVSVIHLP